MDTIKDLLATIDRLPPADRSEAIATVEHILELSPSSRALALGLLALDLAPHMDGFTPAAASASAAEELVA